MKKFIVVMCAVSMLGLSGCAALSNWLHNPIVDQALESVFTLVVDILLKNYAAPHDVELAQKLAEASTVMESLTAGDSTTVVDLAVDAAAKINATDKIDPAIKPILIVIAQAAIPFVQSGQDQVPADAKFAMSSVFKYIADASTFYVKTEQADVKATLKLKLTGH